MPDLRPLDAAAAPEPLPDRLPAALGYLLTDFDDTVTTAGRLLPETFAALHRAHEAGLPIVVVTGGCAGWCDQIARIWPVAAVIGENGAFAVTRETDGRLAYDHWEDPATQRDRQRAVLAVAERLLAGEAGAAGARLAGDQPYRLADVAVDHGQDMPPLPPATVEAIVAAFHAEGIQAQASSIHVNAWIGDYDKCAMARRLLGRRFGLSPAAMAERALVVGDAPNDEPLFRAFPYSVGVANIAGRLSGLTHAPRWITERPGGLGLAEVIDGLLAARAGA